MRVRVPYSHCTPRGRAAGVVVGSGVGVARGADLRGLSGAACHVASGVCEARPRRIPPEDPRGAKLLIHDYGQA
eukprot:8331718-Lingulodinium_polyedra.AAC.1